MKQVFLAMAGMLMCISPLMAAEQTVSSPDGNVVVTLANESGTTTYRVNYKGTSFLNASPLGMTTNVGDFTKDLTLSDQVKRRVINDTYSLPNIKKSKVQYNANEAIFTLNKQGKPALEVEFRVSNNDIAFRYTVHPQGERRSAVVNAEATGFVFPQGTTTFLCPQMRPMTGFARTAPSYETGYSLDAPMGQNGNGNGYTFPCLFNLSFSIFYT